MTVRIVIGTSRKFSGKDEFVKSNFPEATVLNVGDYQRKFVEISEKSQSIYNYINILEKANVSIMEDMARMLAQGENPVMLHTLYKKIRRKEYLEAFKKVTDSQIDIYIMWPSDKKLKEYVEADDEASSRGIEGIKAEMDEIEIPTVEEGFSHVYIVTDEGIKDWSGKPGEKHFE